MTLQEIDRIECAIRHIQTAVDVDPWAVEIAVQAMEKEISALQALDEIYAFIMKSEASETTDGVLEIFDALEAQEAKTQLSAEGTTSDLISRQNAIDARYDK